jgi:SAM-dependent methyltransferase
MPHVAGIRKIIARGESLPFADHSFDLITANTVVEHLAAPEAFLREIFRVLSPGGVFLFHTPNLLYYQVALAQLLPRGVRQRVTANLTGRPEADIFPTYYRLNRASTIKRHVRAAGLSLVSVALVETSPQLARLGRGVIAIELAIIRLLRLPVFAQLRSNLIVRASHAVPTDAA